MDTQGATLARSAGPANAIRVDDTFTRRVQESLGELRNVLIEARTELTMMTDRNVGPAPPQPTGAAEQSKPYGRFDEINTQLAELHSIANELGALARSANACV